MKQPSRRLPPLNALRVFEVVERHLNFRLAAEELGVTQGAVAQQIRGLEETLQIQLFYRLPRGLSLTDQGRRFIAPIRRAMALISEATAAIQPEKTVVSISLTPSFATKWFMPRLAEFTERHLDLEIKITATEDLANFQSDGIDLAVRQGRPPVDHSLQWDLLYPIEYTAVCSPALRDGPQPLRSIKDLAHHILLHDAHSLWSVFLDQTPEGRQVTPAKSLKFNQTALAIDAAISGQGVALVSSILMAEDMAAGRLCLPFEQTLNADQGYYIVSPKLPKNPKAILRVKNWLLSQKHQSKS